MSEADHNIAKVRNAGARAAGHDVLVFLEELALMVADGRKDPVPLGVIPLVVIVRGLPDEQGPDAQRVRERPQERADGAGRHLTEGQIRRRHPKRPSRSARSAGSRRDGYPRCHRGFAEVARRSCGCSAVHCAIAFAAFA